MALLQRTRTLSQQRIDLPDYRAIEDFVCADFKAINKNVWSNENYVFSGFESTGTGTTDLNIAISGSSLLIGQNDGVLYIGAPSISDVVTDALTPAATNYVELIVEQDTGGADSRAFWDQTAGGGAGGEFSQIVDTFIFTKTSVRINTSSFTGDADKVRICEVDVNGSGIITEIRDRRDLFWRLGRGTQTNFAYSWASRTEPADTVFTGADKDIANLKNWVDAVMDSIRELKGTTYWYEAAGSSLVGSFRNVGLSLITALGNNVSWKWNGSKLALQDDAASPVSTDTIAAIRLLDSSANILLTRQQTGQEVQKITFSAIPDAGSFTLEHNGDISNPISFSDNAAAVKAACNATFASTIDTVTGDFSNGFILTFTTPGNLVSITENSNTLTKSAVAVTTTLTTVQNGFTGSTAITLADGEAVWVELPDPLANTTISGVGVTATNFKISTRGSIPNNDNSFWIAYREGSNVYIRNQGELEPGEIAEISDNINENILQAIGIPTETSLPQYDSNNIIADNDSLVLAASKLDAAAGVAAIGANQDRSMKLIEGGTWSVDLAGTTLTWSADAFIDVPEVTRASNKIAAGNVTLPNANSVAYVEINRATGAATLTVNVADIAALVPTANTVIIARRVGAGILVGQHCFLLKASEKLELDGALAEINRLLGQLRIKEHETDLDKVRISTADITLLDGTTLSQIVGDFLLKFDGAVIDFTTGQVFESDGVTPLGNDFTPFTIPSGEYYWYGLSLLPDAITADNKQLATVQVDLATTSNASQAAALKPVISGDIKLGAVQVRNNGGNVERVDIVKLGVGSGSGSGSGAGSARDFYEDRLDFSLFNLVSATAFREDKDIYVDEINSTGAYSPADRAFKFANAGEILRDNNNATDVDFLASELDITATELYVRWKEGSVDPAATYEVSRDGNEWQEVTMEQVGSTNAFRGYHLFTDEAVKQDLDAQLTPDTTRTLTNTGADQSLAVPRTPTSVRVFQETVVELNKLGTPTGTYKLKLVKDNAGAPSTDVLDIVSESANLNVADLASGNNSITVAMPDKVLLAGETYWLVIETDAAYKSSFSAATHELRIRADGTSPVAAGASFNGTVWAATAGEAWAFQDKGRELQLLTRITSSVGDVLVESYGVYYELSPGQAIADGKLEIDEFEFSGDLNRTEFILSNILTPHPDLLEVFDVTRGQVYFIRPEVATIDGQTVTFAADTFDFPGESIHLVFRQVKAGVIDNSDANAAKIAANAVDIADHETRLGNIPAEVVYLKDVKSNTTNGGSSSTSYSDRVLNTLENPNSYSWISLTNGTVGIDGTANQFILQPGTYHIEAKATLRGNGAGGNRAAKSRVQNITDATTAILGQSGSVDQAGTDAAFVNSIVEGIITVATAKTFSVQSRVSSAVATTGYGIATSFGDDEIYSIVKITRVGA